MSKLNKDQQNEFLKCATDFPYFCKTYIKVNGNQPFQLYPYQERLYNHIEDNRYTIFSKFRQGGFTIELAIYSLWRCLFREDQKLCFTATSDREACRISDIIKRAAQDLPDWMSDDIKLINDHKKLFPETNGSIHFYDIKVATKELNGVNTLIIDEASFVDMDANWRAIWPVLSANNSRVIVYSSAHHIQDWFWRTLTDALNNKNKFTVYECDIDEHPEFCCPTWQESMKITIGKKGWLAEYEQNALNPDEKKAVEERAKSEIRSLFDDWEQTKKE